MPFSGLRSSWLIIVRKRDLARLASSACSALRRLISAICRCRRFSRRIRNSDSTLTSTAATLITAVVRALDWMRSRTSRAGGAVGAHHPQRVFAQLLLEAVEALLDRRRSWRVVDGIDVGHDAGRSP